MEFENDQLGNFYKEKFRDFKVESSGDEWFDIEMKLPRNSFLRFGWYHFNIYYAALFLMTFLISSTTGIHYFFFNERKEQHSVYSDLQNDSLGTKLQISADSTKSFKIEPAKNSSIQAIKNKGENNNLRKNQEKYTDSVVEDKTAIVSDSVVFVPDSTVVKKTKGSPNHTKTDTTVNTKLVKKFIYVKKDVIVRDTVRKVKPGKHKIKFE